MDIASLILRAAFSGLFLNAAYQCARFFDLTAADTSLLVGERWKRPAAAVGIGMMLLGGLSVLFNYKIRLGAGLLAVFLIGGTIIHRRQELLSATLREQLRSATESTAWPTVDALAGLAMGGHFTSWLKNLVLLGVALYFVLNGFQGICSLFE